MASSFGRTFTGWPAAAGEGALSFALLAKRKGIKEILLPLQNAPEAALIKDVRVIGVESLAETLAYLEKRKEIQPFVIGAKDAPKSAAGDIDISWVKGQEYAKRALEITAAGGHNVFFSGPPAEGKACWRNPCRPSCRH